MVFHCEYAHVVIAIGILTMLLHTTSCDIGDLRVSATFVLGGAFLLYERMLLELGYTSSSTII